MTEITQKNYEAIAIYRQKEKLFELRGKIQSLETENTKLKKLLKDCKEILWIEELASKDSVYKDELRILIKNINQVLGE